MDNVDDDDDDDVTQQPLMMTSQKEEKKNVPSQNQFRETIVRESESCNSKHQKEEKKTSSNKGKESLVVASEMSTILMGDEDVELSEILSVDASQTCGDENEKILSQASIAMLPTSQVIRIEKSDALNVPSDSNNKVSCHQRHGQVSPSRQVIQLKKSDVSLLPHGFDVNLLPSTSIVSDDASSRMEVSQSDSVCSDHIKSYFDDDVCISDRLKFRRLTSAEKKEMKIRDLGKQKKKKKKSKKRPSRLKLKRKGGSGKRRKKIDVKVKKHKDVECNANGWMESRSTKKNNKIKSCDDLDTDAATKVTYFGTVDSQKTLTQLWT